jgi:hypothetical protein
VNGTKDKRQDENRPRKGVEFIHPKRCQRSYPMPLQLTIKLDRKLDRQTGLSHCQRSPSKYQSRLTHKFLTHKFRIAEVVEREFGVSYHPDHIGRLMHSLGWTPQKPEARALEREEVEIERWKQKEWPRIKKTPQGWAPISSSPMNRASC